MTEDDSIGRCSCSQQSESEARREAAPAGAGVRRLATWILLAFVVVSVAVWALKSVRRQPSVAALEPTASTSAPRVVVYYLHGSVRCATCKKIEGYTIEALDQRFGEEIRAGRIEFVSLNFEEPAHEHLRQRYNLHSQSVVISLVDAGGEKRWKKLDQIWKLVRDKDAFLVYVADEVQAFRGST